MKRQCQVRTDWRCAYFDQSKLTILFLGEGKSNLLIRLS